MHKDVFLICFLVCIIKKASLYEKLFLGVGTTPLHANERGQTVGL